MVAVIWHTVDFFILINMPNNRNTVTSSSIDEAATVASESGKNNIPGFNFRYPTFTEDVFIKHPLAIYLSEKERLKFI